MEAVTSLLQRIASFETRGKSDDRRRNFPAEKEFQKRVIIRRRNFYVEKEFQKRFILFFAGMILVIIVASGFAFYSFFNHLLEQNIYTIHPRGQTVREVITPNLILFFVEMTILALIIIFIAADRILNKTSKSLMKYEKLAAHLANLDFKRAGAADIDSFSNLNKQYRTLMEKYSSDIVFLKTNIARMSVLLEHLEQYDDATDNETKLATMTDLIELKGAIAAKLAEYKTEKD